MNTTIINPETIYWSMKAANPFPGLRFTVRPDVWAALQGHRTLREFRVEPADQIEEVRGVLPCGYSCESVEARPEAPDWTPDGWLSTIEQRIAATEPQP